MTQMNILTTSGDLTAYVNAKIQSSKSLRKHIDSEPHLRETLQTSISTAAKDMFLMAKLHLDLLDKQAKRAKGVLIRAISKLPESLDTTYDDAIDRINRQYSEDVDIGHRVLADKKLLDPPEYLLTKCAGLVEAYCTSSLVRFVHGTVLDYLRRIPGKLAKSMDYLSQTCLTYLLASNVLEDTNGVPEVYDNDTTGSILALSHRSKDAPKGIRKTDLDVFEFRERFPFTTFVVEHVRILLPEKPSEESNTLLMALFLDSDRLWRYYDIRRWLSLCLGLEQAVPEIPRKLALLAVEFGLPKFLLWVLKGGHDESTRNEVSLELSKKPSSRIGFQPTDSALALGFTAFRGRLNILRSLLAEGGDEDALTPAFALTSTSLKHPRWPTQRTGSCIAPSAKGIHGGHLEIVEALVGAGASLEAGQSAQAEHPLPLAIEQQSGPILKFLLDDGASVATKFHGGESLLHMAQRTNIACLNILLELGARVDAMNDNNESPLYVAVMASNQAAISSLDYEGKMDKLEPLPTQEYDETLRQFFLRFSGASIILDSICVLGLFQKLLSMVLSRSKNGQKPDSHISDVDHQMARFNRCSGNIGVFAGGYGSLDYRRHDDDGQSIMKMIRRNLRFTIMNHGHHDLADSSGKGVSVDLRPTSSDISESDSSQSFSQSQRRARFNYDLSPEMETVERAIDRLYQISAALHSAMGEIRCGTTSFRIKDEKGNDIGDAFCLLCFSKGQVSVSGSYGRDPAENCVCHSVAKTPLLIPAEAPGAA
ncbi:hypothetical protein ACJZ2D_008054 [Fusarium nematophilum]